MERDFYSLSNKYSFLDRGFAHSIMKHNFQGLYEEIYNFLEKFELLKSEIIAGGGNESKIPKKVKEYFISRGWDFERKFVFSKTIDGVTYDSCTYKIDLYHEKSKIALDVEWNSKDSIFNRDLGNFRVLHENNVIHLGIIFTRTHEEIMEIAKSLDYELGTEDKPRPISGKYGASTTNFNKLKEKLDLGISGTCPIFGIAIGKGCYNPNR